MITEHVIPAVYSRSGSRVAFNPPFVNLQLSSSQSSTINVCQSHRRPAFTSDLSASFSNNLSRRAVRIADAKADDADTSDEAWAKI